MHGDADEGEIHSSYKLQAPDEHLVADQCNQFCRFDWFPFQLRNFVYTLYLLLALSSYDAEDVAIQNEASGSVGMIIGINTTGTPSCGIIGIWLNQTSCLCRCA
jgi:hypothetical protein